MPYFDLLKEPLFTVRSAGGAVGKASITQILERFSNKENLEFPALRTHQQHPWYASLTQLASLALHHSQQEFGPATARQWEEWLLSLTQGGREPFCLVVENLAQPAFFQPPVPEENLKNFKPLSTPDEMDVLATAKNHDVKMARMAHPSPEHWIYSLITLQTMNGYTGPKNFGVTRMNGGFASRPFVSYAPGQGWGERFCRDVPVLLSSREEMISTYGYRETGGKTLLWLEPWNGETSLELQQCDPFFIEICRRIRLQEDAGEITAFRSVSAVCRIDPQDRNGVTGDPWTPVVLGKQEKALNITLNGWNYGLVQRLLLSDAFKPGATQCFYAGDSGPMFFIASALARKQGGTQGFHERVVPIPCEVQSLLTVPSEGERIAEIARRRVEDAGTWRRDVLNWALLALLQGKPEKLNFRDKRTDPVLRDFDERIDRIFFADLWTDISLPREEAAVKWNRKLLGIAKTQLENANRFISVSSGNIYRNQAHASMFFGYRARKNFPDLFPGQPKQERGEKR